MDLNELFSRHQIALLEMANAPTPAGRAWAEDCSDYYAVRISSLRDRLGAEQPVSSQAMVKSIMRA